MTAADGLAASLWEIPAVDHHAHGVLLARPRLRQRLL